MSCFGQPSLMQCTKDPLIHVCYIRGAYYYIFWILPIICQLCISGGSNVERSFSNLKIIKDYIKSSGKYCAVLDCFLLTIYLFFSLNLSEIINEIANEKLEKENFEVHVRKYDCSQYTYIVHI